MYLRKMWCDNCDSMTEHQVSKLTSKYQNGKQKVKINKICPDCWSQEDSWISARSWIALLKKSYLL